MKNILITKQTMTKLTKAKSFALKSLLNQGPFFVYIHRGFTGLANPRLQIDEAPAGFNVAAFNWLKERGFVRHLKTDDFKEMWDISQLGLLALQEEDEQTANIDARLLRRRLDSPFDNYVHDSIGLIVLRHNRSAEKHTETLPVRSIGKGTNHSKKKAPPLSAATRKFESVITDLSERPIFTDTVNSIVSVVEEYIKHATGSLEIEINIRFEGQYVSYISLNIKARSYDASCDDEDALQKLLRKFVSNELPDSADYKIQLRIVLSRTKSGSIRSGYFKEPFSPEALVKDINRVIFEIKPIRLREKQYEIELKFNTKGLDRVEYIHTGTRIGAQLQGVGGHKICEAIKGIGYLYGSQLCRSSVIRGMYLKFFHQRIK